MPKKILIIDNSSRGNEFIEFLKKFNGDEIYTSEISYYETQLQKTSFDLIICHVGPTTGWDLCRVPELIKEIHSLKNKAFLIGVSEGADFRDISKNFGVDLATRYNDLMESIKKNTAKSLSPGDILFEFCNKTKRDYDKNEPYKEIIESFISIHISLQAFFGYKGFPKNEEAFLLVPEAKQDYFADIFDVLMSKKYKELDKDGGIIKLCALLANTCDYKGEYQQERDKILERIERGLSKKKHFKFPNSEKKSYNILKKQLNRQFKGIADVIIKEISNFLNTIQCSSKSIDNEL